MTIIARRVPSVPVHTATATWGLICDLIAPPGTSMRRVLDDVVDLAAMLIAEEYTARSPIIVSGAGPQIRIYTLHGDDALGADEDVGPVHRQPIGDEWTISLPAGDDDLAYAESILAGNGRVHVRPSSTTMVPLAGGTATGIADIDAEALAKL